MSASDAVPLPRQGEVFFDVRSDSRTMRLSWYAGTGVAVFSIWQGGVCTGTFRLPLADLPRMIETLRTGPVPSGAPDAGRDRGEPIAGGYPPVARRGRESGRHTGGPRAGDYPPEPGRDGETSRHRADPVAGGYPPEPGYDGDSGRYTGAPAAAGYQPEHHRGDGGRYPDGPPAAGYPRSLSSAYPAADEQRGNDGDAGDALTVVRYSAAYPAPGSFSYARTGQALSTDYPSHGAARDSRDDANTDAYFESASSPEYAGARLRDSRADASDPLEFPSVPAGHSYREPASHTAGDSPEALGNYRYSDDWRYAGVPGAEPFGYDSLSAGQPRQPRPAGSRSPSA